MQDSTQQLLKLYSTIYGPKITLANLNRLAGDLSRVAERDQPWTGKFLHSLLKGYPGFSLKTQLIEAIQILTCRAEGRDEIQTRAKEATVLTVNSLPVGTIVLGRAQRCAAPDCPVSFVPTHPRQKYHAKTCARAVKRNRKRSTNGSRRVNIS